MIKLIRDQVAVIPLDNPDKSGMIIIPEIAKERKNQGLIKYRGPDTKHLKIGMYVLFSGYTGTLTYIEGEGQLIIMPERFVIAEIPQPRNVIVPGLFFRDREGYYPANYEQAMNYIALAFGEHGEWRDSVKVINARNTPADLDLLHVDTDEMPSI